eukprot:TRINITY_DN1068_c1_g3_i1.p1 TRINITY_DN1068_c1_g3~~TRINITY_DN1068_c1_g3_i1.p1  ORF type:complete len:379 (-),score=102.53 TRINITY_DN1068_c1_g3_i1:734-1870(-)
MDTDKSQLAKRQLAQIAELCSTIQVICRLNPEARVGCLGQLQDLIKALSARKQLKPVRRRAQSSGRSKKPPSRLQLREDADDERADESEPVRGPRDPPATEPVKIVQQPLLLSPVESERRHRVPATQAELSDYLLTVPQANMASSTTTPNSTALHSPLQTTHHSPSSRAPGERGPSPHGAAFMTTLSQLHGAPTEFESYVAQQKRAELIHALDAQVKEKQARQARERERQAELQRKEEYDAQMLQHYQQQQQQYRQYQHQQYHQSPPPQSQQQQQQQQYQQQLLQQQHAQQQQQQQQYYAAQQAKQYVTPQMIAEHARMQLEMYEAPSRRPSERAIVGVGAGMSMSDTEVVNARRQQPLHRKLPPVMHDRKVSKHRSP